MAVDIHNFYLTDPTYEKFYIIYGPELQSENIGKMLIVTRDFYGTNPEVQDFRNHLHNFMYHLGYSSRKAEPYLCMNFVRHYNVSE